MQICGGAVITALISFLPDEKTLPLALIIVSAAALAWVILEMITERKTATNQFINEQHCNDVLAE